MTFIRIGKISLGAFALLILTLVVIRVSLPGFIMKEINHKLATSSKTVNAHIDRFELAIISSSYRVQGLTLKSKMVPDAKGFLRIDSARISLAWRELFKGRIKADVDIDGLDATFGHEMYSLKDVNTAKEKAADAKDMLSHIVPIDVDLVTLKKSRIRYEYPRDHKVYDLFTQLQGKVTRLSSQKGRLPSLISLRGNFFDNASATVTGLMLPAARPVALELQVQVQKFNLVKANPFLYEIVPFTFSKGELTAFSEIKLENNDVHGYVKPFFRGIEVIRGNEKFKNLKQVGMEVVVALSNAILKNRGPSNSTSARVEFSKVSGKWEVKMLKSVVSSIKHGFVEPLKEDFDHSIHIKDLEKFD